MEGFPWDDLRKIFSGCQHVAKVPNDIETLPKISADCRVHKRYRQTDAQVTAYSKREREFTFGKKLMDHGSKFIDPSGVNLVQNLGDARSRPGEPKPSSHEARTAERGGVLADGIFPFQPAIEGLEEHCKLPHRRPEANPRRPLAISVYFNTNEAIFPWVGHSGYVCSKEILLIIFISFFFCIAKGGD